MPFRDKTLTKKQAKKLVKDWVKRQCPINLRYLEHCYGHNIFKIQNRLDKFVKEGKLEEWQRNYRTAGQDPTCGFCKYWTQHSSMHGTCWVKSSQNEIVTDSTINHSCERHMYSDSYWRITKQSIEEMLHKHKQIEKKRR